MNFITNLNLEKYSQLKPVKTFQQTSFCDLTPTNGHLGLHLRHVITRISNNYRMNGRRELNAFV